MPVIATNGGLQLQSLLQPTELSSLLGIVCLHPPFLPVFRNADIVIDNTNFLVPEDEVLQDDIAGGQSHRANLQHQMQRQEARLYDNGTSGDVRNMSSNATHLSTSLARARITQRVPESTSKHSSSNAKYTRAQLENIRKS